MKIEEQRETWRKDYYRRKSDPESYTKIKKNRQKADKKRAKNPKRKKQMRQNYLKWQKSEKGKDWNKSYLRRLKIEVLSHYSPEKIKCACCNESHIEFLTIDHINNDGCKEPKERRKRLYLWLKKNNYPPGFQILCMNCNFSRGKYGYCPHKVKKHEN